MAARATQLTLVTTTSIMLTCGAIRYFMGSEGARFIPWVNDVRGDPPPLPQVFGCRGAGLRTPTLPPIGAAGRVVRCRLGPLALLTYGEDLGHGECRDPILTWDIRVSAVHGWRACASVAIACQWPYPHGAQLQFVVDEAVAVDKEPFI